MKTKLNCFFIALALLSALNLQFSTAFAQGTAFTYEGQLQNNGSPASGTYSLTFTLFTNNTGGIAIAGPVTNNGVVVANGLFTVLIDFGSGVFTGQTTWLQIGVETNGASSFTTLNPRQQLTPTPYAIYASNAAVALRATTASSATSSGSATSAASFSGPLSGDVTGTQSATVVSSVGGQSAANIAAGLGAVNAATGSNTASTIVKRDSSGNFSAGTITLAGKLILPFINVSPAGIYTGPDTLLYADSNYNFFGGLSAGNEETTGMFNTAIGYVVFPFNQTGSWNTVYGAAALQGNTTGSNNTATGSLALRVNTSGSENTATGYGALYSNTDGDNNTATGFNALFSNTSGFVNTATGYQALYFNTSGYANTANGQGALYSNTTGYDNTAEGLDALNMNTSGSNNTANGRNSLFFNTLGSENTANGDSALYLNENGFYNTANGAYALFSNTTASNNTANGVAALEFNTTGFENTATGVDALFSNTTNSDNTATGVDALFSLTSGDNNTADGVGALQDLESGDNNIALGWLAGGAITKGGFNIDIGNSGSSDDDGIIRIGTESVQTATYLTGTVYADGVKLTSDRNAKENFTAINAREVLARVAALPVSQWNYKKDSKDIQHIGPMAQDFQAAFQLSTDDKHISVVDEGGVALAAIQGLNQKLDEKDAEINNLEKKVDALQALVKQLAANK